MWASHGCRRSLRRSASPSDALLVGPRVVGAGGTGSRRLSSEGHDLLVSAAFPDPCRPSGSTRDSGGWLRGRPSGAIAFTTDRRTGTLRDSGVPRVAASDAASDVVA